MVLIYRYFLKLLAVSTIANPSNEGLGDRISSRYTETGRARQMIQGSTTKTRFGLLSSPAQGNQAFN